MSDPAAADPYTEVARLGPGAFVTLGPGSGGPQRIPRPAGVRLRPDPRWSPLPALTMADVAVALAAREAAGPPPGEVGTLPAELPWPDARPAAVLCAGWDEDGQAEIVLTRRSSTLRSHTGEVAFPGGRLDADEAPLAAALREANEEVGLATDSVTILGRLSHLSTLTRRAAITPYVGRLPGRPWLTPNPSEVERVFAVRLSTLLDPEVHHEELWPFDDGPLRTIHVFLLDGETVWGATARMLSELLDIVTVHLAGSSTPG